MTNEMRYTLTFSIPSVLDPELTTDVLENRFRMLRRNLEKQGLPPDEFTFEGRIIQFDDNATVFIHGTTSSPYGIQTHYEITATPSERLLNMMAFI